MTNIAKGYEWAELAGELSERMGPDCMEPSVRRRLKAVAPSKLLVACSGGADSVFLLCLLYARRAELGLDLHVAHYNHRWRSESSDRDAEFVKALALGLGLPFHVDHRPENEAAFTETTARALRLDFLRKTARESGCQHIAFGHQLDDILETQLQRIARGAGTEGLAAPRPVSEFDGEPTHLRPLLLLRSGNIRMTLNAIRIPWKEDSSNADRNIARNMLRHEVIPDLFEAFDRDPAMGAARSRRLLEEDAAALDSLARERLPDAFSGAASLPRPALSTLPAALTRRALAAWMSAHQLIDSFSAPAMDLFLDQLRSDRASFKQSAGSSLICFDQERVWLETEEAGVSLVHVRFEPGETVVLSNGCLLETEQLVLDDKSRRAILGGTLDPAFEAVLLAPAEEALEVRSWQPGDRFRPLGAPGSKKLKDWFIDRQIPQRERKQLPIVTSSTGSILWVPGFPPAESHKITPSSKEALRLTYRLRKPR